MKILEDAKQKIKDLNRIGQKRKKFYKAIENIHFKVENKINESVIQVVESGCNKLYDAINKKDIEDKVHRDKSESDKYLDGIKTCASVLRLIDRKALNSPQFISSLKSLKEELVKAGNAKFSKTTFGATLDYKPTLNKFLRLSREVRELIRKIEAFLEVKSKTVRKT